MFTTIYVTSSLVAKVVSSAWRWLCGFWHFFGKFILQCVAFGEYVEQLPTVQKWNPPAREAVVEQVSLNVKAKISYESWQS
jgi:hypothetical protein